MTTVKRKARGKYMTKARVEDIKQKEIKKNRLKSHKKAWDTRKALYPETNGYKPKMDLSESRRTGEERGQEHLSKIDGKVTVDATLFRVGDDKKEKEVDVPSESVPSKSDDEEVDTMTAELVKKLSNLDNFLNSIPGVEFDRDKFVRDATTTALETVLQGAAVVCHGQEELTKKLKSMMEFVEEA